MQQLQNASSQISNFMACPQSTIAPTRHSFGATGTHRTRFQDNFVPGFSRLLYTKGGGISLEQTHLSDKLKAMTLSDTGDSGLWEMHFRLVRERRTVGDSPFTSMLVNDGEWVAANSCFPATRHQSRPVRPSVQCRTGTPLRRRSRRFVLLTSSKNSPTYSQSDTGVSPSGGTGPVRQLPARP
jgi:hypothetical protein